MGKYISLYHAFCEFAYAVVRESGRSSNSSKQHLKAILDKEFEDHRDIVAHVLRRECMDLHIARLWVMRELRTNSTPLTEEAKLRFKNTIKRIQGSLPQMTNNVLLEVNQFLEQLELLAPIVPESKH